MKFVLFSFKGKSFMIVLSAKAEIQFKGEPAMNTDKIFAEAIANEYAPKDTSKVVALKKLDRKAKRKANIFTYTFGGGYVACSRHGDVLVDESNW